MNDGRKRFVILKHDHPYLHWDLLLEIDGDLESWRLLREPVMREWIAAEPLPAHRIAYLTYEGPVSQNRGCVTRVMSGTYCDGLRIDGGLQIDVDESSRAASQGLMLIRGVTLQLDDVGAETQDAMRAFLAQTADQRWFWIMLPSAAGG